MDVVADKGVYIGDISEGHHCDLGQIVAVAQEGEVVGEVLLLQATLVDHGLQVPEQSDHVLGCGDVGGGDGAGGVRYVSTMIHLKAICSLVLMISVA